jgi:hypothetical protein
MTDDTNASGAEEAGTLSRRKREPWHRRRSVSRLKKEQGPTPEFQRKWDDRDNAETRLPVDEAIHLGGIVLVEAFTPSTVSALYRSLERWPADHHGRRHEWLDHLARSRSGASGGWQNLGVVRPPGAFVMGDGHHDPDLPTGIDAVWLQLSYLTPALAMVVATFTLSEASGDLSDLLRDNYETEVVNARVRVHGRLGSLRAHVPWSRPRRYSSSANIWRAEDQKRRAVNDTIEGHQAACSKWFFERFPGRFAATEPRARPVIRMLFTTKHVPYGERHHWLRPVGLDFALPLWRSTDPRGWWLAEDRWPHREHGRHAATLATRREDAAEPPTDGETGDSNWYLTQRFGDDGAPLASRRAIVALLDLYADRLGSLRDRAGKRSRPRRPVRDGRVLDEYLIRDGLDAATISSDLQIMTRDLTEFRWGVPEFVEDRHALGEQARATTPLEYVPALCESIRERAARLAADTDTTTANIRASAELRHAIANTRLQRVVVGLAVVAAVIGLLSILLANH